MGVAKVIEIVGSSEKGFDDAVRQALDEARKSIRGITGVDVRHFTCKVRDDDIVEYRVDVKIAFGLDESGRHLRDEAQRESLPPLRR
ncbi:MAG: dodecin family protein [Halobacteriales archaeon]|nr:dodecin family protein [Halobacteriales archaeon]